MACVALPVGGTIIWTIYAQTTNGKINWNWYVIPRPSFGKRLRITNVWSRCLWQLIHASELFFNLGATFFKFIKIMFNCHHHSIHSTSKNGQFVNASWGFHKFKSHYMMNEQHCPTTLMYTRAAVLPGNYTHGPFMLVLLLLGKGYSPYILSTTWLAYSISQEICTRFCCALLSCGYAIVHNEFT